MKAQLKRNLRWLGAIVILLLLLLVIVRPSSVDEVSGLAVPDDGRESAAHQGVSHDATSGRRVSSSRRKLRERDPLDAHVISVDDKESVLFVASEAGVYDGVLIHLKAVVVVDESGVESVRLTPKIIDAREAVIDNPEIVDLQNQNVTDTILSEHDEQVVIRKVAMTRGVDLMTMLSQGASEDEVTEFVLVPGVEEILLIKGRLEKGRDGKIRLNLGHPYVRPREERKELLEALGFTKKPE